MKIHVFCLLFFATAFWSGCATQHDGLESKEQIRYYDRNHDGKIDLERHYYPGVADADWELRDDDFNGRYEKKILCGYILVKSAVEMPVPTNVCIEPKL